MSAPRRDRRRQERAPHAKRGAARPTPKATVVAGGAPRWMPPAPGQDRLRALAIWLLVATGASGVALAIPYAPDASAAHASVGAISVGAWRWARALHAWAASALLVAILLLMARAWLDARGVPGRRRWAGAVALLAFALGAFLTGRMLPWDHHAWESYLHLARGAALVGLDVLAASTPGEASLGLVFAAHVVLAAGAALAVAGRALLRRGNDARAELVAALRDRRALLVAAAALVATLPLAPRLGPAPVEGLVVSRPDWPFLWLAPLQEWWGDAALFALPAALVLLLLVGVWGRPQVARWGLAAGAGAVFALCVAALLP